MVQRAGLSIGCYWLLAVGRARALCIVAFRHSLSYVLHRGCIPIVSVRAGLMFHRVS